MHIILCLVEIVTRIYPTNYLFVQVHRTEHYRQWPSQLPADFVDKPFESRRKAETWKKQRRALVCC